MRAIDGDKVIQRIDELERHDVFPDGFNYHALRDEIEEGKFDIDTPAPPRESQKFYRVRINIIGPTGLPGEDPRRLSTGNCRGKGQI